MDGNGRWAQRRGLPRMEGHRVGANTLKEIVKACPSLGIRYLTVYAFSSENWKRSQEEVSGLMRLFELYLRSQTSDLHKEGAQLKIIGDKSKLSPKIQKLIHHAETLTENNSRFGLQVALNYGGKDELVQAAQSAASYIISQGLSPKDMTPELLETYLWTYPWPDPDFLIRTGGEVRLSNYLPWQLAYTEFLFLPQCWPDFKVDDFKQALEVYRERKRQFGGTPFLSMGKTESPL